MKSAGDPLKALSPLFRTERAPACCLQFADSGERPDPAVYTQRQGGHEPSFKDAFGLGEACLYPRNQQPEIRCVPAASIMICENVGYTAPPPYFLRICWVISAFWFDYFKR